MRKKIIILSAVLVIPFFLFGCERKDNSTSTTSSESSLATDTSTTSSTADEGTTTGEASETASESETSSAALAADYIENLNSATTKVQKALSNTATFCTVLIEIPSGYSLSQASQQFFFTTTNEGLKDWYWVVTVDPIENKERHSLVAKSGYKDELECTNLTTANIEVSYNEAYDRANETGALSSATDAVKTKITLKSKAWKISQYNSEGSYSSKEVDATNAYVSTSGATTTATVESIIE